MVMKIVEQVIKIQKFRKIEMSEDVRNWKRINVNEDYYKIPLEVHQEAWECAKQVEPKIFKRKSG